MLSLLQRVTEARVEIDGQTIASIGPGILVLIGFHREDTVDQISRMAERILSYRLFADDEDRMNRSVKDCAGALLLIPQFTLAAETDRGLRASFSSAAAPEHGRLLFEQLLQECQRQHSPVSAGQFGAHMQVHLVNDGPVSFLLDDGTR